MNGPVTVYLPETGEIVAYGMISLANGDRITYPGGEMIAGHFDAATHWVTNDEPPGEEFWVPHYYAAERPVMPTTIDRTTISADGEDEAVISAIPDGAEISVDGGAWAEVGGSTVEFAATVPGTYTLRLRCWPHIEAAFEVTAT